jgi:sn-1 stearoyl-lipid 9-desaturase
LFPNSARSGFKPYQIDTAWYYIKFLSLIGAVSSYRDSKKQFYLEYCPVPVANKKQFAAAEKVPFIAEQV